jgi:energy-coupling factor transporter ATP-binding protein EcfA2
MISELKIRNFKSLESVDLKLGHFNLLVGANASGKSNFLDALRFLQGIGNGLNLEEILDGKPPSGASLRWPGIRGGARFVVFQKPDGTSAKETVLQAKLSSREPKGDNPEDIIYALSFDSEDGAPKYDQESVTRGERLLMKSTLGKSTRAAAENSPAASLIDFSRMNLLSLIASTDILVERSGLADEKEKEGSPQDKEAQLTVRDMSTISRDFRNMQFLDPIPSVLRDYSSRVERMSESGEGFAALIHEIGSNGSKPALLEWLKELRPDEVDDIYALKGLVNDYMVAIKEGNKEFLAPVLSEGTLRFIALAAAFFQPSMPKVLVIEEIEKGLHPSRLRLLLELMRSQSKRTGTQVFATTHSPTLLAWLTEEDRKTTFVCTRDAESGATKMRSLAEVPRLEELVKEHYNLDELFEQGWIESVLHES